MPVSLSNDSTSALLVAEFFGDCGETPAFGLDDYVIQVQCFCLPEILKGAIIEKRLQATSIQKGAVLDSCTFFNTAQMRCQVPVEGAQVGFGETYGEN